MLSASFYFREKYIIMKEYNEIENAVIKALIDARRQKNTKNLCASRLIIDIMDVNKCFAVEWDTTASKENVTFYCQGYDVPKSIVLYGLEIISFLKYLENNEYIIMSHLTNTHKKAIYDSKKYMYKFGYYWGNMQNNQWAYMVGCKHTLHTDSALLFDEYANTMIYPTNKLELFYKRGFRTRDDIRFQKQQCATWIGILITILASLNITDVATYFHLIVSKLSSLIRTD